MLIKELRVPLPLTVEEYQVALLWSVAEASKNNTGGGDGIEVLKNEPFKGKTDLFQNYTDGQYTHKIYRLQNKVPGWVKAFAPKGSLEFNEIAWNAYPYCRTTIDNPGYMKENFFVRIESLHLQDKGDKENVFQLPPDLLAKREVVYIDIANDPVSSSDYKEDEDPAKFLSTKTGRGKLGKNWRDNTQPIMCAYKLVTVEFKWFGLQGRVEKFIQHSERRLFTKFHRQLFCWIDKWHGLTMEDIRRIEDETQKELANQIKSAELKGDKLED